MTPRTLFTIILKVLGLCFSLFLIYNLNDIIILFVSAIQYGENQAISIASIIILLAIYLYVIYQLLNPYNIINWLKLDKGFNEKTFKLATSEVSIYLFAIIIAGGFFLVSSIPDLLNDLVYFFFSKPLGANPYNDGGNDYSNLIITILKFLLGLLIIGERKRILQFMLGQKNVEIIEENVPIENEKRKTENSEQIGIEDIFSE